jgi:hypothetical protein
MISNRKTRSRLEGVLTAKNFDTETIQKLTKIIPKKELLQCSAELYDLYIKDYMKESNPLKQLSPSNTRNVGMMQGLSSTNQKNSF